MRYLLRGFLRSPGFFLVVVATLAVGIGANTAIFSVIRGVLLRPLPYPEPDRLVSIGDRTTRGLGSVSALELFDIREQADRLEGIVAYAIGDANLTGTDSGERVSVGLVTPDFFGVLGVAPSVGRLFARGEDTPGNDHVVVLGHDLWNRRFAADRGIVGKDVLLDGESHRVIGVLPATFRNEERFDLFVPLTFTPAQVAENARDWHFLRVVARLRPGVSVADANRDLALIGARLRAAHPRVYSESSGWRPEASLLLDSIVADVRPTLWLLAAAAALVLVIVCGNVASLLLARATTRQRELSVRAALGASRRRLFMELLRDSLVLSAIGGALGVLTALWGTDLLLSLAPDTLPRGGEIRVDGAVLAFSVLVTAVTGTVFGMIPAWSASRVDIHDALRAGTRTASSGKHPRRIRRALVVGETALALVLVTAAALITRSFNRVINVDPGFRTAGVLSLGVTLPKPSERWFAEATARLAALPGVTQVGAINLLPLRDGLSDRLIDLEGAPTPLGEQRPDAEMRVVIPGTLETLGIPLLLGRLIGREDTAESTPVVVVSQGVVRELWPEGRALSRRLRLSSPRGPWATVVGVVGDVRQAGLDVPPRPTMYFPAAQVGGAASMAIVVRGTASMGHLAGAVRGELERFDPQQPIYDMLPMSERMAQAVEQRRFVLVLFELFAGLALGLAALGLYGVLAHTVAERRREIGVRVALGATRGNVLRLVAREGAVLVGVGVALGIAGGIAGVRLLTHMLYETSPTDPLALMAAVALLAAASAVAMWLPVRRALRVDPMVALRDE